MPLKINKKTFVLSQNKILVKYIERLRLKTERKTKNKQTLSLPHSPLNLVLSTSTALNLCNSHSWTNKIWSPIYFTSFSSISYWSNSEYWTQKCAQSGNIHSIILDVHVGWQSTHLNTIIRTIFLIYFVYLHNLRGLWKRQR